MKKFMCNDFLLETETAKKLYHNYAKNMPIFDYHCHLSPKEIATNKRYKNISEIWLYGDHYKWRAMRSNGVPEEYITGNRSDKEKFMKWAETVPYTIGNPLYHWTHLELKNFFDIDETLTPQTAEMIWAKCNKLLSQSNFTVKELIKKSNVKVLCTTDDPADDLQYHIKIAEDRNFSIKVLPTFRPDRAINIDKKEFNIWVKSLGKVVHYKINSYSKLISALSQRIDFFHEIGCRISDHGLNTIYFNESTEEELEEIFLKGIKNERLSQDEIEKYITAILLFLGKEYSKKGWTMQLHLSAIRNNNSRMFATLGPDTGFDSIGEYNFANNLSKFLDTLDFIDELPKTIIYSLNPKDNYIIGTMIGNFQRGNIPCKIQFGSGWWFNDQKDGILEQIKALSNLGLLSRFVGMLTDSRSFLSYTRHEYFRRILCNYIGTLVEKGEYPDDFNILGKFIEDISYNNAKEYFDINL